MLVLISAGKGNATITHELMISLKTVQDNVSNIVTKLQVSDPSAAMLKARRAGLGDDWSGQPSCLEGEVLHHAHQATARPQPMPATAQVCGTDPE